MEQSNHGNKNQKFREGRCTIKKYIICFRETVTIKGILRHLSLPPHLCRFAHEYKCTLLGQSFQLVLLLSTLCYLMYILLLSFLSFLFSFSLPSQRRHSCLFLKPFPISRVNTIVST